MKWQGRFMELWLRAKKRSFSSEALEGFDNVAYTLLLLAGRWVTWIYAASDF